MTDLALGKLQSLLRTLFQFDSADLNFGIYRVLNYKRREISAFIETRLPVIVDEAFARYAAADRGKLEEEVEQAKKQIVDSTSALGMVAFDANGQLIAQLRETPAAKQYLAAVEKMRGATVSDELKSRVYNDLFTFFNRYYEDGDFISKRRRGREETYAIPYNGEEVLLHWANKDQYYIKTDERLAAYRFHVGEFHVAFEVRAAESTNNNNKSENRFYLVAFSESIIWDADGKLLTVAFQHRGLTEGEALTFGTKNLQDKINAQSAEAILAAAPDATLKGLLGRIPQDRNTSVLLNHLLQFTRRNTLDFFIHKDLSGFLTRELDHFIKTEALRLDEMLANDANALPAQVQRARATRDVATSLIDLLAQVEDFQKRLFEKKKFVLRTDYCLTLDRVPEAFWPEVLANEAQTADWQALYGLDEIIVKDGVLDTGLDADFLSRHLFLMIDTRHFSNSFKWQMLSELDELDSNTDGVLLNSENYQALNLLVGKYYEQVQCTYVDPPYNTGVDDFIYKDGYQHSSWLSLISDRLSLGRLFLTPDGTFLVSINDDEQHRLREACERIFGADNFMANLVWKSRQNVDSRSKDNISNDHEFVLAFGTAFRGGEIDMTKYSNPDHDLRGEWMSDNMVGLASIAARPNLHYHIHIGVLDAAGPAPNGSFRWTVSGTEILIPTSLVEAARQVESCPHVFACLPFDRNNKTALWIGFVPTPLDHRKVQSALYTCPDKGWRYEPKSMGARIEDNRILWPESTEGRPRKKTFRLELKSAYTGFSSVVGFTRTGTEELSNLFGHSTLSFPKPISLITTLVRQSSSEGSVILDFFAGSGTTGHAVINLNRENGGNRKYVLVEMGEYFPTVLLPRLKKAVFCSEWKDGKPVGGDGISQTIKYHTLEQYEDTLNNLEVKSRAAEAGQAALKYGDEYLLQYMLDFETQGSPSLLNLNALADPFDYKLNIKQGDAIKPHPVDLVETFNYLLGLTVIRLRVFNDDGREYCTVLGEKDGKRIAVVWRKSSDFADSSAALAQDKEYIIKTLLPSLLGEGITQDRLYANSPCAVAGSEAIEPEFKRLMFGEAL